MSLTKTSLLLLFSNFIFIINLKAQNKFWDNVTVRKAFETKTIEDSKPAIVSYTNPKDKPNSFLINGGIGYDFFQSGKNKSSTSGTGFFVYNKNNQVSKIQNNYKLGITVASAFDQNNKPTTAIFGASSLQYMHNYIDTTHSVVVTSYWHPFYTTTNFPHIGGYVLAPHIIDYFFLPQAGVEYQNIFDANSKSKKGYDIRLYYTVGVNIKIKKKSRYNIDDIKQNMIDSLSENAVWQNKTFKEVKDFVDQGVPTGVTRPMPKNFWTKLIEFSVSHTGRYSLVSHNSNFEKYIPFFIASLNFYPLQNENFSFGISYNKGANPIDGILKQNFWVFALSFKK